MYEEGLRVRPIINDDFHRLHKNIILVLLLDLSVWPSGLGHTPVMPEGPGSGRKAGKSQRLWCFHENKKVGN